jgi:hypothetical protein
VKRLGQRQAGDHSAGASATVAAGGNATTHQMVLCKDCRFSELHMSPLTEWICSHPTSRYQPKTSLVTGDTPDPHQLLCSHARWFDTDNQCGPRGRHWEQR